MIPGLSTIKTWIIAGLGVLASIMSVLFFHKKSQHESAKRKGQEKARKVERAATDAMGDGLKREQEALENAKSRTGKRDHFTK